MADNVAITAGTGTAVAADEVNDGTLGVVKVQYVKIMGGALDSTTKAVVGASGGLAIRGANVAGTSGSIGVAGTGTIGPLDVSEAGNVTFTVKNTTAASAFTGSPVIVFEQSDDNVSWGPLNTVRSSDNAVGSTFVLAPVGASGSMAFDAALEGVSHVRARVTTGPTGFAMTVAIAAGGGMFMPVVTTVKKSEAGRRHFSLHLGGTPVAAPSTEALLAVNAYRDGVAVGASTSHPVIAANRTLRLTHGAIGFLSLGTAGGARVTLRANLSGVAVVGSPAVMSWQVQAGAAAAGTGYTVPLFFPDGMEFAAGTGLGISHQGLSNVGANAASGFVHVGLYGFEY